MDAILETPIKEPNLNLLMADICPNWSFSSNHLKDPGGHIVILWKAPLSVVILYKTRQSVTGITSFYYTAIYAANTSEERTDLWVELLDTQANLLDGVSLWIVGGDFYETIHPADYSAPHTNQIIVPMRDFKAYLDQLEIRDLRFHGPLFTWTNKQPDDPTAKKLERAIINEQWINAYPHSLAKFLAPEISDHSPCCVSLLNIVPTARTRPFKFFNFLTAHPDFLSTAMNSWSCQGPESHSLLSLSLKQKELKKALKTLHKDNFSDNKIKSMLLTRLHVMPEKLLCTSHPLLISSMRRCVWRNFLS